MKIWPHLALAQNDHSILSKLRVLFAKTTFSSMEGIGCQEKCEIYLDLVNPFVHFVTQSHFNQ